MLYSFTKTADFTSNFTIGSFFTFLSIRILQKQGMCLGSTETENLSSIVFSPFVIQTAKLSLLSDYLTNKQDDIL